MNYLVFNALKVAKVNVIHVNTYYLLIYIQCLVEIATSKWKYHYITYTKTICDARHLNILHLSTKRKSECFIDVGFCN